MVDHGLSEAHLEIIRRVLAPFAPPLIKAGLFGSRATGRFKPSSDIDVVLYGDLPESMVNRIWTDFQNSSLPFQVDVIAYQPDMPPALKHHIDCVMQPLLNF